jgi:hypothetical protein
LIPWLRSGDTAYDVLAIAGVEIELGEELLFGQGICGIDAEVGLRPEGVHAWRAADFNAPPNTQAIGQAGLLGRGHVEIALTLELCP